MRTSWKSGIGLMAVVIIGGAIAEHGTYAEPKEEVVTTVRVEDIPRKVHLIGRCGQPLGRLLTIRGQWIRPNGRVKDDSLRLRVDVVNGKDVGTKTEIHEFEVVPITLGDEEGRGGKDGESWDWRFDQGETDSPPTFGEGERYEILGVETGSFEAYSHDVWREIRGVSPQSPALSGPFSTRLNFIAVRRLPAITRK